MSFAICSHDPSTGEASNAFEALLHGSEAAKATPALTHGQNLVHCRVAEPARRSEVFRQAFFLYCCFQFSCFPPGFNTEFWVNSIMMSPALVQPEWRDFAGLDDFGGFGKLRSFTKGEFLRLRTSRYLFSS